MNISIVCFISTMKSENSLLKACEEYSYQLVRLNAHRAFTVKAP